jgi:hypothetical protein
MDIKEKEKYRDKPEMSIADEKLPLPHRDDTFRCFVFDNFDDG